MMDERKREGREMQRNVSVKAWKQELTFEQTHTHTNSQSLSS
jgi:hypothetical protein